VPAFKAPAVSRQLQQGFWGGPRAGEQKVGGMKGLAFTGALRDYLDDPAGADPFRSDALRGRLGPQRPGDVTAVAFLAIRCHKKNPVLSLELAEDPAVQGLLVGYSYGEDCVYVGQEEVGPLLLELLKNGFGVRRASAWISTPSRSSSSSSCRSTARSWFSAVA